MPDIGGCDCLCRDRQITHFLARIDWAAGVPLEIGEAEPAGIVRF